MKRVLACCALVLLLAACGDDDGASAAGFGGVGGSGGVAAIGGSSGSGGIVIDAAIDASGDAAIDASSDAAMDSGLSDSGGTGGSSGTGGIGGVGGTGGSGLPCKAGRYVGSMSGMYRSPVWGNGETSLLMRSVDVDEDTPGLELRLVESNVACDPGAQFCAQLTVSEGVARGVLDSGQPVTIPFEATITGALDCRTGEFRGRLDPGSYSIFNNPASFAGTLSASFDTSMQRLVNGIWDVDELNISCPPSASCGGEGTWSAAWVSD